jgi:hypothetical protein
MKHLFYILIAFTLTSCSYGDDLFKSYGEEVTATRQVGDFDKIIAGEKFDVILIQDSSLAGKIEITAGKNVIDGYTTKVENGQLSIRNENHFNWVRKLKVRQKVRVYFKNLNEIQINGSAIFSNKDTIYHKTQLRIYHAGIEDAKLTIVGDYIFADCSNSGGVTLNGKCFLLSASVDDISFIHSDNLDAEKVYLSTFSQDDNYIKGLDVVDIKLFGHGSVYYKKGNSADVVIEDIGTGSVFEQQ